MAQQGLIPNMADWLDRLPIGVYISAPVACRCCGFRQLMEMTKIRRGTLEVLSPHLDACPGCGAGVVDVQIQIEGLC